MFDDAQFFQFEHEPKTSLMVDVAPPTCSPVGANDEKGTWWSKSLQCLALPTLPFSNTLCLYVIDRNRLYNSHESMSKLHVRSFSYTYSVYVCIYV